jgi:hypothetical protein
MWAELKKDTMVFREGQKGFCLQLEWRCIIDVLSINHCHLLIASQHYDLSSLVSFKIAAWTQDAHVWIMIWEVAMITIQNLYYTKSCAMMDGVMCKGSYILKLFIVSS